MMYAQVHPAVSMHIEDTMYSMWVVGVMSPYPMLVSVIRLQWRHTTYLREERGVGVSVWTKAVRSYACFTR